MVAAFTGTLRKGSRYVCSIKVDTDTKLGTGSTRDNTGTSVLPARG